MKKTSTTNILAKIFKKTPEKKVKKKSIKKVAKKPKAKVAKKITPIKKATSKIKKNLKTVATKLIPQKIEEKTNNLRISKSNETKPEIKR